MSAPAGHSATHRVATVLALILVACLLLTLHGSDGPPGVTRPLVFAHHGDTTVAPENTIAAIRAATGWADGIEIDVHLAPDGTWRLRHGDLLPNWRDLPTLDEAVAAAGNLLLCIDLKEFSDEAHRKLALWIARAGIAHRTEVNVKSISGAQLIRSLAPGTTIEAQPEWVPTAATAPEIDIVIVWGANWRDVLKQRPSAEVGLFVNSIAEPGLNRWLEALSEGISRYFADGSPYRSSG